MDRYHETFQTWNKVAQLYQEKFMDLSLYNESYDRLCEALKKKNSAVLELGCGPGNITKYLLSKRPDFNIDALDVAPEMIRLAQQNVPKANFNVMDVRDISQIQKKYDAIVCGFCMPYLSASDWRKCLADCTELLLSGGVFYLSFVAGNPNDSDYQQGSSGDRTYFYYHDLEDTIEEIKNQNFTVLNLIRVPYLKSDQTSEEHTIIIAKKVQ